MRFASLALLLCDYAWLSFSLRLQSSFAEKACCVFACQLERPIGLLPSQLPSQFRKTSLVRAVLFPSTPLKMGITDKLDKGYTLYLVNINSTQRLQSAATLCSKQGVCMVSLLLMLTNHVCILWCFCIATCGSLSRRLWQVKIQTPYVLTMSLVIQYRTVLQSYFSCRCSQECYVSQEEKKKQFTCQPCC